VPESARAAQKILSRHLDDAKKSEARDWAHKVWLVRGKRELVIESYNTVKEEMLRPHLTWYAPGGARHEVRAERASYQDNSWVFTNAQEWIYPPTPGMPPSKREVATQVMDNVPETPQQINGQIKINQMRDLKTASNTHLSIREILDYQKWNPDQGSRATMLNTKLHGRIADPWKCMVIVLIAMPFGATTNRRNVYVGVASSILIGFGYFVVLQLGLALGSGGHVPAPIAAWAPNFLFAGVGLFLSYRAQ